MYFYGVSSLLHAFLYFVFSICQRKSIKVLILYKKKKKNFELWSLTLVLKCCVEFLCTCTSMWVCVHMHGRVPVGEEERENILSNPPEQFRRSYSLLHLANMLKWIEEINLGCICKLQTTIFFWRWVFITSMNILPQQCKESAQLQPCVNIFAAVLCLVFIAVFILRMWEQETVTD